MDAFSRLRSYVSPAVQVPPITNEPILSFAPGSQERKDVEKVQRVCVCKMSHDHILHCLFLPQALAELRGKTEDIPCIIGGQEVRTGKTRDQLCVSFQECFMRHCNKVASLCSPTITRGLLPSFTLPGNRRSSRP